MNERERWSLHQDDTAGRRLLRWIAPLCIVAFTAIACTTTTTKPTAHAAVPTVAPSPAMPIPTNPPTATAVIVPTASVPMSGLVVTILATDVALWQAPDTRSGHVAVSFTINGNPIQTSVFVSGEVPVLETNIVGADGSSRWTRVMYSGYAGPLVGGTSFSVMGYLRNDLISTPHAPGAPAKPNP